MIAIHNSGNWSFRPEWVEYCEKNNIPYKLVNAYDNNIIDQLAGCGYFLFHHHHTKPEDVLFAKSLLFSMEQSGIKVFPDFNTGWHFDDKVGQKYLLEAVHAPIPRSYVFFDKKNALNWAETTSFPKVFKLRGGAGSLNVKLVNSKIEAIKLVQKAFGSGFSSYNKIEDLKENWRRYKMKKSTFFDLLKSIRRGFAGTEFSRTFPIQKGYVYFQDFVEGNDHDIRIITVGNKAIGIKRMVRENDFRASGSGNIIYDPSQINMECIKIGFDVNKKLNAIVVAYDFVFEKDGKPLIVEINYGFAHRAYNDCPGWWDKSLNFHEGKVDPCGWMIEELIKENEYKIRKNISLSQADS